MLVPEDDRHAGKRTNRPARCWICIRPKTRPYCVAASCSDKRKDIASTSSIFPRRTAIAFQSSSPRARSKTPTATCSPSSPPRTSPSRSAPKTPCAKRTQQLEKRHQEIEEDLLLAARVQQSLAPTGLTWGGVNVATYYQPVRTIGGDFGLVAPRQDSLSLFVCDVSGHGIGSALVANRIYTETMSQIERGVALGPMMHHLNRFVLRNIGSSVFYFTMIAARLDRDNRTLEFANAGHPPAMIVQPGQAPRLLESGSAVLGLIEDAVGKEATVIVPVVSGDRLVIYTDGFTESFNQQRDMLGVEGLSEIVRETSKLPLQEMKEQILQRVTAFRHGPPDDDMSLVIIEIP